MTPQREAFILPGLFLTVTLLGGLRVDVTIRLLPPPLAAIVLAVALVGALVRARVVVPSTLISGERKPLENLSGAIVLVTLLAATAQAINVVLPERGLLHFAFAVFLFVQLLSLSAAGIDRPGMLRSLFVLLGSAFVLRFIVLESLYAPDGGTLKRVLTALLAGVTLGGIEYRPHAAVTGYVAFLTLSIYMIGLVLLPSRPSVSTSAMTRSVRDGLLVPLLMLILVPGTSACSSQESSRPKPDVIPQSEESLRAAKRRDEALQAARVWMPPPQPPAAADLGVNPDGPGSFAEDEDVECRFVMETVGGLTPKFNCQLADGTIVKVKYGSTNGELPSEVAATRLLRALGFGADRMYVVRSVRCAGCPRFPYPALRCLAKTGAKRLCFPLGTDSQTSRTFDPAVIERRMDGRKIEAFSDQGWAWFELDAIDPERGASPRADIDALKLLAVFLAHWDNKAENQRLVCLPGGDLPDGGCSRPFAMIQDTGATFGPARVDLRNWRSTPIWVDPRACRVGMETLPYAGATFPEQQISEDGRRLLLGLLEQLSTTQIETLFTQSRITTFKGVTAESRSASAWTTVFLDKLRQIRDAGPCPQIVDGR
jgi:hypothetical protein